MDDARFEHDGLTVELALHPTEGLVEIMEELRRRERASRETRQLIEAELLARLSAHKAETGSGVLITEAWELRRRSGRQRVWDGAELERVLFDLVDDGWLRAGELTGLVTQEFVVDKAMAAKLLDRLHGEQLEAVRACFHWEPSRRPSVDVVARASLMPGGADA